MISDEAVEAAARAIKDAMALREGPFGLYDYTSYGNPKPHVVRDFRPSAEKYGAWLFQSTDRDEALREYTRLTDAYLGRAALEAALPHLLDREKVARVIYYVHGEGVTVESALGEKNDVHWNHWKDQSDADDAWRAADAILAHPQKGGEG